MNNRKYNKQNVKIPSDSSVFKISTLNVNLNDNINRDNDIKIISEYVFSELYGIENDIICLQGINNDEFNNKLISKIKSLSKIKKVPIQIVPIINPNKCKNDELASHENSIEEIWNTKYEINNVNNSNIIISKYPILASKIIKLNTRDINNKETKHAIVANINISGYIVSIFNIFLTEDYIGVSNNKYRNDEIINLMKFINENTNYIKEQNKLLWKNSLIIKNINLICGCFNIPEIINNKINAEFINIFKNAKLIDLFKCYNMSKKNYIDGNTVNNYRNCYMTLHYYNSSNSITEMLDVNGLFKKIFDIYGIGIILSCVINHIQINQYHPIETIFILYKKEKIIDFE